LIARDVYDGIRQAQPSDVRAVEDIIRPLEKQVRTVRYTIHSHGKVFLPCMQGLETKYVPLGHMHEEVHSEWRCFFLLTVCTN
jgi:N-acetylglutamate synthase-like GNAT family acetyltransferase